MKKILIISDNPRLTEFVKQDILPNIPNLQCKFCYSSNNRKPFEMQKLGAKKLDIKDKGTEFSKKYDFIFSLHCKQIFPKEVVNATTCINVHPGLNPYNRGWYPQVFSIINKLPAGATIHIMNEEVDAGGIIAQKEVSINEFDCSYDVYERVQETEMSLLKEWFPKILKNEFTLYHPLTEGNYNSISDFNELCNLDLQHIGTFQEHLDLLKALSHKNFKNAYFLDKSGNKKFLKIEFFE